MSERARILVVDDNATNRRLLKLTLSGGSHDLDVADSASAALIAIAARRPALILLDLQLPDCDGLELTRQLRRDPANQDLIIVAVTSHSAAGHRELALAAGCDDYLTKPIDTRALPTLVAAILAARRPLIATAKAMAMAMARIPIMADPRVLVVDDTAANRRLVAALLSAEGFTVEGAEGGVQALEMVEKSPPDLILLDLQMPGMNGLTVLRELRKQWPDLPVVMQTAHGDIPSAVEAIKLGADDFLTRPTANDKLVLTVRHALERHQLRNEVHVLRKRLAAEHPLVQKMGPSPKVAEVVRQVAEVAESPLTVLIQGETGTGKELVARAIHSGSQRSGRPFIAVDCGAIPETLLESELFGHERGAFSGADRRRAGLLELAEGGSLFLDEIGNLPAAMQAKMLRVMQEREVRPLGAAKAIRIDVRFIAATHARLAAEVAAGKFREDLFFRLAEYTIVLPPLRTRLGDVRPLAMRFLDEAASELRRPVAGLSDEALARLTAHAWPGNVRELRNIVRQVSLQSEAHTITHTDIDRLLTRNQSRSGPGEQVTEITSAPEGASLKEIADHAASEAERQAIVRAMRATGGNKSQAARRLKVDYKTLHLKIRRYGLAVGRADQDAAGAGGDDDEGGAGS